jgi:hypothetical protein
MDSMALDEFGIYHGDGGCRNPWRMAMEVHAARLTFTCSECLRELRDALVELRERTITGSPCFCEGSYHVPGGNARCASVRAVLARASAVLPATKGSDENG